MVTGTERTVRQWLEELSTSKQSSEKDDQTMQYLCRRTFPAAVVTCGIVYLEGKGQPIDIHTIAREILARQ